MLSLNFKKINSLRAARMLDSFDYNQRLRFAVWCPERAGGAFSLAQCDGKFLGITGRISDYRCHAELTEQQALEKSKTTSW
jgi:hypothetical protein